MTLLYVGRQASNVLCHYFARCVARWARVRLEWVSDKPWCGSLDRYKRRERISAELSSAVSIPGRHQNSVTLTMGGDEKLFSAEAKRSLSALVRCLSRFCL